jgi:hypothetical protein
MTPPKFILIEAMSSAENDRVFVRTDTYDRNYDEPPVYRPYIIFQDDAPLGDHITRVKEMSEAHERKVREQEERDRADGFGNSR